jgi:carbon-monoxide dehydrogenase small subunit
MSRDSFSLRINGEYRELEAYPMERLLDVLRERFGLTGTKEGCGEGECVNSCLVPIAAADGTEIVTIEGVANSEELHPAQKAFLQCGGAQCGMCTPGMIVATVHLLDKYPQPTMEQIREGLNGNLCRCTGYMRIFEAVEKAANLGTSQ